MLDYIKRICIALALAAFIGMLFLGTMTTLASGHDFPNELTKSLVWPTVGELTDTYGARGGRHYGIDLAAPKGTPVISVAAGVVSRSYFSDSYGHVVFVKHDNGLETVYAHLNKRHASEGQVVREGELIGTVGNSGRSTGNHLHFEVHVGEWNLQKSESIDPIHVLSNKQEYIYAAVNGFSPNEEDSGDPKVVAAGTTPSEKADRQTNNPQLSNEANIEENEKSIYTLKLSDDDTMKTLQINSNSHDLVNHVPIKFGDTLSEIANEYEVAVQELIEWNDLKGEILTIGSELVIYPTKADYIIHKGDTLSSIAKEFGVSIQFIMEKNNLESDLIYAGEALNIH